MDPRPSEELTHHSRMEWENFELTTETLNYWLQNPSWPASHVIQQVHACLMSGIEGYQKKGSLPNLPGQYRKEDLGEHYGEPNFFSRGTDVVPLMEQYSEDLDTLLKSLPPKPEGNVEQIVHSAAWAYYTFIRIHPFLDGNGRVGRIIINRIIQGSGMNPIIYDFEWYEGRRNQHLDAMELVHKTNDLTPLEVYLLGQLKAQQKSAETSGEIERIIARKNEVQLNLTQKGLGEIWEPFETVDISGSTGSNTLAKVGS